LYLDISNKMDVFRFSRYRRTFCFHTKETRFKMISGNFLFQLNFLHPNKRFSSNLNDIEKDSTYNVPANVANRIGKNLHLKNHHPINTMKIKIENHFCSSNSSIKLGEPLFERFDNLSPLVTVENCFDSLLIPSDHEIRSVKHSYYINKKLLLRPHTSAHQFELLSRGLSAFLVSGDVYRRDEIDSVHYPVFHQMDGVRVFSENELRDKNENEKIVFVERHMKQRLESLVTSLFGEALQIRWVDAYFPFTNPSWELEIFYNNRWLEVLGCGLIHSKIMENSQQRNKKGWAFGIGLERLAMALCNIPDIRLFWTEDRRFHEQFTTDNITTFKAYSKFPSCFKDVAFWLPGGFHANDFHELLRFHGGDLIESVELIDSFKDPKSQRESHCYRINYRSMDRNLTNEEINELQEKFRKDLVGKLGVELR